MTSGRSASVLVRRAVQGARIRLDQPWSGLVGRLLYLPAIAVSGGVRREFREEAEIERVLREGGRLADVGVDCSERVVEVPWVLRRVTAGTRVLDVGTAHAPVSYRHQLVRCGAGALELVDLAPASLPGARAHLADVRSLPLADDSFDATLCISTIEHIGYDNRRYVAASDPSRDERGDVAALRELGRVTRAGGSLLVTVPAGVDADKGWFRQYSPNVWAERAASAGLEIAEIEYFAHDAGRGWSPADAETVALRDYGEGAPAAAAVICCALRSGAGSP